MSRYLILLRLLPAVVAILLTLQPASAEVPPSRRTPVVEVVASAGPAVVNIRTEQIVKRRSSSLFGFGDSFFDDFFRGFGPTRVYKTQSLGSGVIIDRRGYVLTNAHVVAQASKIFVAIADSQSEVEATLVGLHERLDLAVLKLAGRSDYPFVEIGTSDDLLLGETVIAIGNPLGLGSSVTTGVISSAHRRVPMEDGMVGHFIQSDALINPGNSGGPLLNIEGKLIGINTAIARQAQGIGFSIPIDMARRIAEELIEHGRIRKPYFGILPGNVNRALVRSRGVGGVLVTGVEEDSPAAKGRLEIADVILAIDRMTVESPQELLQLVNSYAPGDKVVLRVLRGVDEVDLPLTFSELPSGYGMRYSIDTFGLKVKQAAKGVVVAMVSNGSHAEDAGFRLGDRVAEVDGIEIDTVDTYVEVMESRIGQLPLSFLVVRGNRGYYVNLP